MWPEQLNAHGLTESHVEDSIKLSMKDQRDDLKGQDNTNFMGRPNQPPIPTKQMQDRPTQDTVDTILENLVSGEKSWIHDELDGTHDLEQALKEVNITVEEAKLQLQALVNEVIGENLPVNYIDDEPATDQDDYNERINIKLEQQRIKATKLFGGER